MVVAAVLERGDPALSFPSSLSTVLAVVASDSEGSVRASVADHQSVLAAPGVDVLTTVPKGAYDFLSGSSFATAHVSGIIALLLERNPEFKPQQIRELLLSTARPTFSKGDRTGSPLRHVDACAALQRLVPAASCGEYSRAKPND